MNKVELGEAYGYMFSLPAGSAALGPLIEEVDQMGIVAEQNQRFGIPVINTDNPTDQVNRLLIELDQGFATIRRDESRDYKALGGQLDGNLVINRGKISHLVDGKPDEFDGWFVAEEFFSEDRQHPFLLLEPSQVQELSNGETF